MAEQVFSDRYKIVRHLARGGMAEVYVAHDQLLDRPVALKVLFPEFAASHSFVERFRREARAAANLNHPNIVAVYDWGEEGQTYFIVMEYIEGSTIRELILKHRRLSPRQAAAVGAEIASALAFAHKNGVIHRDVKPGNVIISDAGHVKVMDFGIARAGDPQDNLTQTGAVMGTATYFSPEQAQGKPLDGRSDLYSLGVVLYEVVAGTPPFTGENPVSIAYQHVREEPTPLRDRDERIPEAFEAIVTKAMAKNLDHRYANADEFRADLLRFREGKAVEAEQTAVAVEAAAADATAAMAATRTGTAVDGTQVMSPTATQRAVGGEPSRRTGAYIALLVVLLGALGLLLVLLARSLGVTGGGSQVTVPTVFGKPSADAVKAIENAGLKAEVHEAPSGTIEQGKVFSQTPGADSHVKKGTKVVLQVSSGPPSGTVPSVIGQSYQSASEALVALGFRVTRNAPVFDPTAPPDQVIDQTPDAGSQVARGQLVRLTTSKGPQPTTTVTTPPTTEAPPTTFSPIFTPTTEPPTTTPRRTTTTTEP